jgi:hypothetical protein
MTRNDIFCEAGFNDINLCVGGNLWNNVLSAAARNINFSYLFSSSSSLTNYSLAEVINLIN